MIIGRSSNDEGDSNENVKENNNRFIEQNNKFAFVYISLYISLPSLHDYDVKIPNFTFYRGF